MSGRRPQDPRTRPIRDDDERNIATMGPDPGATVAPDEQRAIATVDPSATVLPTGIAPPKPRMVRGGAAATYVPGAYEQAPASESIDELRARLRAKVEADTTDKDALRAGLQPKAAVAPAARKKKSAWLVWVVAFVVLGGIGFGVSWLLINADSGGAGAGAAQADDKEVSAVAAVDDDVGAGADEDAGAGEDASAVAGAGEDAGEGADAGVGEGVGVGVGVGAGEGVGEGAGVGVGVGEDASSIAGADTGVGEDASVVAVVEEVAVAAVEEVAVVVADTAGAPDSAAAPDVQVVAVVPPVEAVPVPPKPVVRNPIEATRLNEDGLARRKRGDHDGAMVLYLEALAADPSHVWARYNYACELALAGRTKDALTELTTLYKLGTSDAKRALAAARKDSDFASIKDSGQFFRLTTF